ncbi:MAG: helix-turn-helix transcriptional regulator [Moorea sp. SIO3G5]|nr:helix-turn-helix transcriptional regulator [Moorena sp. SIO3G5]
MKVTTKLAQLRANYGNISYEEISESTGIDRQQLRELENGEANASHAFRQSRRYANAKRGLRPQLPRLCERFHYPRSTLCFLSL